MKITLEAENDEEIEHLKIVARAHNICEPEGSPPCLEFRDVRESLLLGTYNERLLGMQPLRIGKGAAVRLLDCMAGMKAELEADIHATKLRDERRQLAELIENLRGKTAD